MKERDFLAGEGDEVGDLESCLVARLVVRPPPLSCLDDRRAAGDRENLLCRGLRENLPLLRDEERENLLR